MDPNRSALLDNIPLFASLREAETRFLAEILHEAVFPAGMIICAEGEPGCSFDIIAEGEVEIIKALSTADERLLAVRGPGDFYGEMSLLEPGGLRTATVRARTPLCLLRIDRDDFDALLQNRPALANEIMRVLSLRLRESDNATIAGLHAKNQELARAYDDLRAAQAQIIKKEKLEQELRTAHWIQQSILPHQMPALPGFDFGARMEPARAVGGDLFDFIPLGSGRIGVVIGDVSDKGVPAAIFMAMTHSLLRGEARRSDSPAEVLRQVNHLLGEVNDAGMFVTVLYGVLDGARRSFCYARAGHELPLVISPDGTVTLPELGRGQPLALFEDVLLDEQMISLAPGSAVLMYTDGATDMRDAQAEEFGLERLQDLARSAHQGANGQELCDRVWQALRAYQGAGDQDDDVALVAIRAAS